MRIFTTALIFLLSALAWAEPLCGTYKVQADTLWLYFKTPSPYRVGAPVDSGNTYRYRITKIRKKQFLLQGVMQGVLLGSNPQKYRRQRGKTRLEGEQ